MNRESQKLECPKCVGILREKEIGEMQRMPVHIDQCPMCMGIWFDKGELDKVLQLKIDFDEESAEEQFRADYKDSLLDLKEANCPRCRKKMERIKAAPDDRVITDYCMECDGVWLDGGEIRVLMRGGPIERAINFVLKKISAPFQNVRRQY